MRTPFCFAICYVICISAFGKNEINTLNDERPPTLNASQPLTTYAAQCHGLIKLQEFRIGHQEFDLHVDKGSLVKNGDTVTLLRVINYLSETKFSEHRNKNGGLSVMPSTLEQYTDMPFTGQRFVAKSNASYETVNCKTRVFGANMENPTHWIGYFNGHCGSGQMAYAKGSGKPTATTKTPTALWIKSNREVFKEAVDRVCAM